MGEIAGRLRDVCDFRHRWALVHRPDTKYLRDVLLTPRMLAWYGYFDEPLALW